MDSDPELVAFRVQELKDQVWVLGFKGLAV